MTATTATQHYRGTTTGPTTQLAAIGRAYVLAGLEPPTRSSEVAALLAAEPTETAVANDLAREALTAPDPRKFVSRALDQLARANRVDVLRTALARASVAAEREALPGLLAQAVTDLADGFTDTVDRLTAAAAKLPADQPLDVAAVAATHTTRELESARQALGELSVYVGVYQNGGVWGLVGYGASLATVLPLVAVPVCAVALVESNAADDRAVNADELGTTMTVRALARDVALTGPDTALINVARGNYPGVSLKMAGPGDTITDRRDQVNNAHTPRRADRPTRSRTTIRVA